MQTHPSTLTIRILAATTLIAASMFSVSSSAVMAEWPTRAMLQQATTAELVCRRRFDFEAGVTHRESSVKVVVTGSMRGGPSGHTMILFCTV